MFGFRTLNLIKIFCFSMMINTCQRANKNMFERTVSQMFTKKLVVKNYTKKPQIVYFTFLCFLFYFDVVQLSKWKDVPNKFVFFFLFINQQS